MKLFKKNNKPEEVKMDENGNVINPEPKKEKGKDLGKKLLIGAIGAIGGVVTFVLVGVAMGLAADSKSSDTVDAGNDCTSCSDESSSGEASTEATGTSEE